MPRSYQVIQYGPDTRRPASSVSFTEAERALEHFEKSLVDAGWSEADAASHLRTFLAVLMKGGRGHSVLDPDFKGHTEIIIHAGVGTPTPRKETP